MIYEPRAYRQYINAPELVKYEIKEKETDLLILTDTDLSEIALKAVFKCRQQLEEYIKKDPVFLTILKPHNVPFNAPQIVKDMAHAAKCAGVGPMAAVAGAVAEYVGKALSKFSENVIIENGGDIFMKTKSPRMVAVHAGKSPFSEKICLKIDPQDSPLGICTSSGTVGHSLSFGKADAVVVLAKSASLSDAAATAIANQVQDVATIQDGLDLSQKIKGLLGVLIIKDDQLGVKGRIKIEALS